MPSVVVSSPANLTGSAGDRGAGVCRRHPCLKGRAAIDARDIKLIGVKLVDVVIDGNEAFAKAIAPFLGA